MASAVLRNRISHRSLSPPLTSLACWTRLARCPPRAPRRCLSNESQATSPEPLTIENIRLQNEFEENRDIREYLRKWQQRHPNILDPVRGPGTTNSPDGSLPWVGNMLNDNRVSADAGDSLHATEAELSDFNTSADEGAGVGEFLEPGDLVALLTSEGTLTYAIYVRSLYKQDQFYTTRGKWRIAFSRDLDYVIKGFASPEMVAPLLPNFPDSPALLSSEMQSTIEGGVPRPLGAPLLHMIEELGDRVQDLYRANVHRLDRIHELVADEQEALELTLEELACRALEVEKESLNSDVLLTVHVATRRNPFLIEKDRSSVFSDSYLVQPLRVAKIIDNVTTWAREHQELQVRSVTGKEMPSMKDHPMVSFTQKAKRLIRLSRQVRSPTIMASVGPSAQRFEPGQDGSPLVYREILTEEFSKTDREIIQYLQMWSIPPRRMSSGLLRSTGSHIMQATGMYNTMELNSGSVSLLLQEIGVFSPWENTHLLDQSLSLPGHGISKTSDAWWENVTCHCEKLTSQGLSDIMKDARTDFGDLPVYCVDDPGAEEIDDGVSLERIPGSEDTFWIRVHIANPTAFVGHEDEIMQYAASRLQTFYTPERTYPMIPKPFTQDHFSLAAGRPTLTFSAKMNLNGEVLETDIVNGTINNVIYITHGALRSLFTPGAEGPREALTVGGTLPKLDPRRELKDTLSPEDEDTFHLLRKLMLGFREQRLKNGALEWPSTSRTSVSMSAGDGVIKTHNMNISEGRYFLGDPIIQLRLQDLDPHEVGDITKQDLISTLMNMACWVSGKWCAERKIPTVYNATFYHPEYPRLTGANIAEYGGSKWLQLAAPRGISSSSPLQHVPLGLSAYVKSTSPLRRYTDVISHYQIEAALRFEREHGRPLDATADESALPFSREQVDDFLARSRAKSNKIRLSDSDSKQYWACMLLFRAFYFGECELPETFNCLVHKPYSSTALLGTQFGQGYAGVITALGVRCQLLIPAHLTDVDILSIVEAKIVSVDLSRLLVVMEATRVVRPFQRVGECR